MNFWHQDTPLFALAPMEDVTDTAFREVVARVSDSAILKVLYTEFTSTDGMTHSVGRPKVSHRLMANESELQLLQEKNIKLVAQIWGTKPEKFNKTAQMIEQMGYFDGIDINMGCPVKKIVKQGACSALINQVPLAKEIILATKAGTSLPVSVKTRTGIARDKTEEWIADLIETRPAAIILHGRTQADQSEKPARWDEITKAVKVRNRLAPDIPLIGNGDVFSMHDGQRMLNQTNADGVMIGRGIFHNPWFFNHTPATKTPEEKLKLLWQHTDLYCKTWSGIKNFAILKRFFKIYTNDFAGAKEIRIKLMETNSAEEVKKVLEASGFNVCT